MNVVIMMLAHHVDAFGNAAHGWATGQRSLPCMAH